uniref:IRG-type G domain-containing protein n=1 Tax=Anabas testudineus TaxID=64144 RepID=A0A3Q1I9N6_ANATE
MSAEDSFDIELDIDDIKEKLQNNDFAAAVAKIQSYLKKQNEIALNIGVAGECGSGKSTFVNAIRGLANSAEGAAPTNCVETTMEVKFYPHPNYPNIIFWDLPGDGTTKFPAHKYLKHVGFERFDFFIIISADRFRENDVKLALEIKRMQKKFYFVRSKIDHNLRDEEDDQSKCFMYLKQQGFESPQVFLVSSFELQKHDFSLLYETLEKELPEHKRHALLLAMPNINLEIIEKKKEAFQANIKYVSMLSGGAAAVPVPGLSTTVDVALMVCHVTRYVFGFGLDLASLKRLSNTSDVPLEALLDVIISPLAAKEITVDLVMKLLSQTASTVVCMAAEELSRFIPFLGIPLSMSFSVATTYRGLKMFLNMLADDAQRVRTSLETETLF